MKIVIIGRGNVGTNLHYAFARRGANVELVQARALLDNADALGNTTLPVADVYIYTIADHALSEVIAAVDAPKALHLHTSGSVAIDVFGDDKPHAGVAYFFQSFSKSRLIEDWSDIPVFIEGRSVDDVAAIYTLAQTLTDRIYECTQRDRERLHVAGVFANNFSNLMFRMAEDILRGTSIPFAALLPLIDQTAEKVHTLAPETAQTGPAQRGDENVLDHHLKVLQQAVAGNRFSTEEKTEVYQLLSRLIESQNKK
ncbi:MAG: DUF2520 domain-containing protein [Paludibacteraceae bacterium]|nr:DUF2520 domain-containing protein [Paludibacteraceae bacterium]